MPFKRQIGQVYSKSGIFFGMPSISPFIAIFLSGNRDMTKTLMNNLRDISFNRAHTVGAIIFLFILGLNFTNLDLNMVYIILSLHPEPDY